MPQLSHCKTCRYFKKGGYSVRCAFLGREPIHDENKCEHFSDINSTNKPFHTAIGQNHIDNCYDYALQQLNSTHKSVKQIHNELISNGRTSFQAQLAMEQAIDDHLTIKKELVEKKEGIKNAVLIPLILLVFLFYYLGLTSPREIDGLIFIFLGSFISFLLIVISNCLSE